MRPVGVLGLDDDVPFVTFNLLLVAVVIPVRPDNPGVVVLLGMRDGVSSVEAKTQSNKNYNAKSVVICLPVLSKDKLEPCLDGGLLPGRLP